MGRKSVMISFDSSAFRDVVKNRGNSYVDLEPITGVSKQAINSWLSTSKIPPRQLHSIAKQLNWTAEEMSLILKNDSSRAVRFRSHRNTLATTAATETAIQLSTDFFTLDSFGGDYNKESLVFRVGPRTPAHAIADGILRQLGLTRGRFGLDELIQSLNRVNVSVIFVDFGILFDLSEKESRDLKAFCAKRGSKFLITIDSRMKIEDVSWAIFHELAHIVCGDIDADPSVEISPIEEKNREKFMNEVASEVLTPTELLQSAIPYLKDWLNCDLRLLPSRIEHLSTELGASFVGTFLALKKIELLAPQKERYLWGVHNRRTELQLSVRDLIIPKPYESLDEFVRFWDERINTEDFQKFLKLHLLVRQGIIEERISVSRAAELMGLEAGEMEDLANHWLAEVSDEVTY